MTKKAKTAPFDPKVFLATVNGGRSISKYRRNQKVFSQGTPADAVFYIQKGKVKVTVLSEQGKEAVVAVLGPDEFCGEGCLTGQPVRLATWAARSCLPPGFSRWSGEALGTSRIRAPAAACASGGPSPDQASSQIAMPAVASPMRHSLSGMLPGAKLRASLKTS